MTDGLPIGHVNTHTIDDKTLYKGDNLKTVKLEAVGINKTIEMLFKGKLSC